MTPFPSVFAPTTSYLTLSGSLTYEPWVRFSEKVMDALSTILDKVRAIGGCENPEVIADWRECARDDMGKITHRSSIILYQDGGDWAEEQNGHYEAIGVLFCREDIDQTITPQTVTYRVHVPDPEWQDKLLAACDLIDDLKRGDTSKLNLTRAYLSSIINEQAAWKPLVQLLGELALGLDDEEDDEED